MVWGIPYQHPKRIKMYIKTEKVSINASTVKAVTVASVVTKWLLGYEDFYFTKMTLEISTVKPTVVENTVKIKKQKQVTLKTTVVPFGNPFNLNFNFELVNPEIEYGTEWVVWSLRSPYRPKIALHSALSSEPLILTFYNGRRLENSTIITPIDTADVIRFKKLLIC